MPAASLVMGGVVPEHAGSASGLLQTVQQLGGAIGLAVIVSAYAAGSIPLFTCPRTGGQTSLCSHVDTCDGKWATSDAPSFLPTGSLPGPYHRQGLTAVASDQ